MVARCGAGVFEDGGAEVREHLGVVVGGTAKGREGRGWWGRKGTSLRFGTSLGMKSKSPEMANLTCITHIIGRHSDDKYFNSI